MLDYECIVRLSILRDFKDELKTRLYQMYFSMIFRIGCIMIFKLLFSIHINLWS